MPLLRIISGGQTGVDRGALDAAPAAGFPCGGWCPADRSAEDGTVPEKYPVAPLPHGGCRARTRRNVEDSDGTVILAPGEITGGTALPRQLCRRLAKPVLVIDASDAPAQPVAREVLGAGDRGGVGGAGERGCGRGSCVMSSVDPITSKSSGRRSWRPSLVKVACTPHYAHG